MKPASCSLATGLLVVSGLAGGCGIHVEQESAGIGAVGSGGGTEIFEGGAAANGSGTSNGNGSSGNGSSTATSGSSSTGSAGTSTTGMSSTGSTGTSSSTGSASTSSTGNGASGDSSSSSSTSTGSSSSGTSTGSSSSAGASSSAGSSTQASGGDAGTGTVVLILPTGPVQIVALRWQISGPNTYVGYVDFTQPAQAGQSVQWVIGGVLAADNYTLSVTALDTVGETCEGTSPPFDVEPDVTSHTTLTITCPIPEVPGASGDAGPVAPH